MKIERIEDKKFMITITEKEALRITDSQEWIWEYEKIYALHLGRVLIHYMIMCSEVPDMRQPALDTEL